VCFGVGVRLALIGRDLPYYQVDENEIVEQAYVFLSGDLCPSFFSYGPLLGYALAGLYALAQFVLEQLVGLADGLFFYRAVFEPTPFYVAARTLHAVADVAAVALAARLAGRNGDSPARWAVLALGAAPLLSLNTDFAVRNDTFLGLFTLAALGLAAEGHRSPGRSAALAGVAAGFAIAVKPLQALLVLPSLVVGVAAPNPAEWRHPERPVLVAAARGVAILLAATIATHSVLNPCSLLDFGGFWRDNAFWVGAESPSTAPGWQFGWWVRLAGWPLGLFAALAIPFGLVFARRPMVRLALVYVATVVGAYLFFGVRPYWYNGVLPSLLVLTGVLAGRLATAVSARSGLRATNVAIALGVALAVWPLAGATADARRAWWPTPSLGRRTDRAAQLWIEERIPSGSRILAIGRYALGMPRLVAETPRVHGEWADHYMYGRGASRSWVAAFKAAYRRHRHQGAPLYWIKNVRRDYTDRWPDPVIAQRMHETLPALARQGGARYVVTGSSSRFVGRWEARPDVRLLAEFTPESHSTSETEIKVFELLPEESGS